MISTNRLGVFAALSVLINQLALMGAFAPQPFSSPRSQSILFASQPKQHHESYEGRRDFMARFLTASGTVAASTVAFGSPAHASYSAYTHREQDWENRQKSGDIQVSNAKALRQQLREIVPMNSDRSKMFCPNGTPSSVSPLMENKCNDRETMPSVFGRTQDVVGNSIPGFVADGSGKYASSAAAAAATNLESTGGFPDYGKVSATGGSR